MYFNITIKYFVSNARNLQSFLYKIQAGLKSPKKYNKKID